MKIRPEKNPASTTSIVFITARIPYIFVSSTEVHLNDFDIFTVIHSPLRGFIWKQNDNQLLVGLLAQLVEHCTCIFFFQALFSFLLK